MHYSEENALYTAAITTPIILAITILSMFVIPFYDYDHFQIIDRQEPLSLDTKNKTFKIEIKDTDYLFRLKNKHEANIIIIQPVPTKQTYVNFIKEDNIALTTELAPQTMLNKIMFYPMSILFSEVKNEKTQRYVLHVPHNTIIDTTVIR